MFHLLRGSLLVLTLTALAPNPAEAQLFRRLFDDSCLKCRQPLCSCTCTCLEPVVETCLKPEQCVNYRNVQCTGTRQEAYCETVPVQKYENVCVDEGCWKMVWCPKPVMKTVCKTEYEQRTACRNVPYTYNVCVPEVTTRIVPEQRVRYVPRTVNMPVCPQPCPQPCPTCQPAPCVTPVVPQTTMMPPSCAAPGVGMPGGHQMMPPMQMPAFPQHNSAAAAPAPAGSPAAQWNGAQARRQVPAQQSAYPTQQGSPLSLQPGSAAGAAQPPSAATVWQTRPTVSAF